MSLRLPSTPTTFYADQATGRSGLSRGPPTICFLLPWFATIDGYQKYPAIQYIWPCSGQIITCTPGVGNNGNRPELNELRAHTTASTSLRQRGSASLRPQFCVKNHNNSPFFFIYDSLFPCCSYPKTRSASLPKILPGRQNSAKPTFQPPHFLRRGLKCSLTPPQIVNRPSTYPPLPSSPHSPTDAPNPAFCRLYPKGRHDHQVPA